jgi:DNA-binding transcriptional MocR family regulator
MVITTSAEHTGPGRAPIALMLGHPDPTTLATPEFRAAVATATDAPDFYQGLQYGPEAGTRSLLEFLQEKSSREQGLAIGPANIMLVAGATHAVDMLARLYAKPGGVVLIEAPTYPDALHIFRDHQIELHAIPTDEGGLIVSALEERLAWLNAQGKSPTFLYTIPTFHNPRGSTLSAARRHGLLELAGKHALMIVEDEVYRDLSFNGKVPATCFALAQGHGQRVCSIGSFSKTLAPGVRLGWLVAPQDVIDTCMACGTTLMGGGASPFSAQVVAQYCRSGQWEPHVRRLRSIYATRRDLMVAALERYMPAGTTWTRPEGGFFVWLTLPPMPATVRAREVQRVAHEAGVAVAAGEPFFLDPRAGHLHLRLAYSYAAPADLDAGIRTLAHVVEGCSQVIPRCSDGETGRPC